MFRKPTEFVPSTVQLLKVPEAGVPSTGAVNVLLVSVCEVFVLATSVKVLLPNAIVLLVTVFVLVAVSTLVGVMMSESIAMAYFLWKFVGRSRCSQQSIGLGCGQTEDFGERHICGHVHVVDGLLCLQVHGGYHAQTVVACDDN